MSRPFVLAFDPGTRKMGYALLPSWGRGEAIPAPLFCGSTTHTSSHIERRLAKAHSDVAAVMRKARRVGEFVCVYEIPPMYWRKGKPRNGVVSAYMLGQAVATIRCACVEEGAGLPRGVEVSAWRKAARALGMIGADPKTDSIRWMKRRFDLDVSHDTAEACILGTVVAANISLAKE